MSLAHRTFIRTFITCVFIIGILVPLSTMAAPSESQNRLVVSQWVCFGSPIPANYIVTQARIASTSGPCGPSAVELYIQPHDPGRSYWICSGSVIPGGQAITQARNGGGMCGPFTELYMQPLQAFRGSLWVCSAAPIPAGYVVTQTESAPNLRCGPFHGYYIRSVEPSVPPQNGAL